tara:strand:- start:270 stop:1469 length:1200 start_codon:yes stop_codon:yes gene_type:complete
MSTNTNPEKYYNTVMGGSQPTSEVVKNTIADPNLRGIDPVTKKVMRFDNENKIERNQYNIGSLSYPIGVGKDEDKQHFIQFFINVRGKSKFNNKESINGTQEILDKVDAGRKGQNGLVENDMAIKTGAAAAGFIAGGGASIFSDVTSGKPTKALATVGKAGLAAVATKKLTDKAMEKGLINPDIPKRLKDSIVLHIQDKPTTNYSVQYNEDKIGSLLGGITGSGRDVMQMAKDIASGKDDAAGGLTTALVAAVSSNFGAAGRLLQLGTKTVTNAFREQFFESVDYRTFNFRHTFMPKSREEANNVRNIIRMFKFHMMPEMGFKNLFFIYPSEFEIKYYFKNQENIYFDRISTCVLEDMSVEYGGDIFATFANGNPVEVNMSLKFKELELMTKERIKEGF